MICMMCKNPVDSLGTYYYCKNCGYEHESMTMKFNKECRDKEIAKLREENERLKTCKCCNCQSEVEFMLRQEISKLEECLKRCEENLIKEIISKSDKFAICKSGIIKFEYRISEENLKGLVKELC